MLLASSATPASIIQEPADWPRRPASPVLGGVMLPPPPPGVGAGAAPPTLITPTMPESAWSAQMYWYVPGASNFSENVVPFQSGTAPYAPEFTSVPGVKTPVGPLGAKGSKPAGGGPARKVTVCGVKDSLTHSTVSPTSMLSSAGLKRRTSMTFSS